MREIHSVCLRARGIHTEIGSENERKKKCVKERGTERERM
jgi:hypothetical protein